MPERGGMLGRTPKGECSADGCNHTSTHRGYCKPHYLRWRRHGDPLAGGPYRVKATVEGFWAQVNKQGPIPAYRPDLGPCWIWTGKPNTNGYGLARLPGFRHQMGAHLAAWWLTFGEMPSDGSQLDHLCRIVLCCKPAHLEPVTPAENNRRSTSPAAINAAKSYCDSGHEFTPANTRINRDGSRACRACACDNQRRYRKRAA